MDIQKNTMNNNISFLRIRPCDNDNEIYLNSRKKEGTSTFLIKSDVSVNTDNLHNKEFQTVSKDITINSDVWMVTDENWKEFKSLHPKRLIYIFKNNIEIALEVIDRLKPHTILISTNSELQFLKSINSKTSFITSTYVETIEEAIEFANAGVSDLLLRDWSAEQILELQNLEGLKEMTQVPDIAVVIDPKRENTAVLECRKLGIPIIAILDTNCDPNLVDIPIPANDDAVKSIKLILSKIADGITTGKNSIK